LLAAGASGLGLEPLHIQVRTTDCEPALSHIKEIPFDTALIKAERGERITDRIRARARSRPRSSPVIVDMPAQDVLETLLMLSGMKAQMLVPMPEWVADPRQAIHDYRRLRDHWEHWEELNRQSGRRLDGDAGRSRARLFPVGWPSGSSDELRMLLRGRSLLPDDDSQYPILHPGLPRFDPGDMEFSDGDGRFALTERQLNASARTASPLCGDTAS
jgi:hypothetical protein